MSHQPGSRVPRHLVRGVILAVAASAAACGSAGSAPEPDRRLSPSYNLDTGRLEQITSDRNGDGAIDTWAHMNGTRLERIELDRDGNGTADRVEYYDTPGGTGPDLARAVISRVEEMTGPGEPTGSDSARVVTRREFYKDGVLERVEEDTDADGRVNRWEEYVGGALVQMDLDLGRKGFPNRRLIYGPGGARRAEVDVDGDGAFEPVPSQGQGQ